MSRPDGPCAGVDDPFASLREKAWHDRVPVVGSLDLTHRCNLGCVHCYAGPLAPDASAGGRELSTGQVTRLLDELSGAGCLFLLVSGGEPLLRTDFPGLYAHARERGLIVTVFTNGTLVTDEIADLFSDYPPRAVEITLYGATDATAARVTGRRNAFAATLRGIERLADRRVPLRLKTMLLTLNLHEFDATERLAAKYSDSFRLDAAVTPRLDGDRSPLRYRVAARDAVDVEFRSPPRREAWREYWQRPRRAPPSVGEPLYRCGAGRTAFQVDPYGTLRPCLMVPVPAYDLTSGPFDEGWREMSRLAERKVPPGFPCSGCERRALCHYCPGAFGLETGDETSYTSYTCGLGRERLLRLESAVNGEESDETRRKARERTATLREAGSALH